MAKKTKDVQRTDYASSLECELTGAIYTIRGLLHGAIALSEEGTHGDDDQATSAERCFQIQHCLRVAIHHLEAAGERIEIAVPNLREGKPIGKSPLFISD